MSRSYWLSIIAVVGWLIASVALAEETKPNQASRQGSADGNQQSAVPPDVNVRILEEPEQSEGDKRQQEITSQREKDDLAAQQAMADGTKWLVWISIAQIALASLGTVALLYSLSLSRRATKAAIEANENTLKAITQDQTNAKKQLRAYAAVEYASYKPLKAGSPVEVTVRFQNTGETPAKEITTTMVVSLEPVRRFPDIESQIGLVSSSGDLGSGHGEFVERKTDAITSDQVKKIRNGSLQIVAIGKIAYRDVFDDKWIVRFRVVESGTPIKGRRMSINHISETAANDPAPEDSKGYNFGL